MEWEEGFQARGQSSGMTSPHQQRIHLCSQLTTIPHRARSSLLLVLSTRISVHDNDIPPTTYTSISCYICITVTPRWVVISVSLYHCHNTGDLNQPPRIREEEDCHNLMSCYISIIVTAWSVVTPVLVVTPVSVVRHVSLVMHVSLVTQCIACYACISRYAHISCLVLYNEPHGLVVNQSINSQPLKCSNWHLCSTKQLSHCACIVLFVRR